jgi:hypothetical protein
MDRRAAVVRIASKLPEFHIIATLAAVRMSAPPH